MPPATEQARFEVRVIPNAKKESVELQPDGTLRVRVTVPPADGRANKAVVKLLSRQTGVKKSRISIVKGTKSRNKVIVFTGASRGDVEHGLG